MPVDEMDSRKLSKIWGRHWIEVTCVRLYERFHSCLPHFFYVIQACC